MPGSGRGEAAGGLQGPLINVNKLFRRLSIRTKLVIAFVLLGVVPVAVVGGYGALFSFALLNETVLDGLRGGVQLKAGEVEQFLDGVRGSRDRNTTSSPPPGRRRAPPAR